jgi:DNA-binding NtrC family response regulator
MRRGKLRSSETVEKPKILLTFVGSHDPFRGDNPNSGDGPIMSLLAAEKFSEIRLFYNNDEFLKRASGVLRALMDRRNETPVKYERVPVVDPTDHAALYEQLEDRVLAISKEFGPNADLWIAVSSGTPQMQTCWMLLVLGGVIKARLIQILPPHKVRPNQAVFREIKLSGVRFPKITPPGPLERRLALAERELEELRAERKAEEMELAPGLIGSARAFREAVRDAKRLAEVDMPVLLLGETGTGKDEFAKLIHFNSSRKEKPFLPINCGSLPKNLVESELFGHVKGAFTDAQPKVGIFEIGDKGTVFLDEIAELPANTQATLLRVLESGDFRPIGATAEKKTHARIIAATNRDLDAMVAEGAFRQDLLFRIKVAHLLLPPLRERREDIVALAVHFLEVFSKEYGRKLSFDSEILKEFERADWPGNVRELKSTVLRLAAMATGEKIRARDFIPTKRPARKSALPTLIVSNEPVKLPNLLQDLERDWMEQAISRFQGNRAAAARHLGYEGATFRKKCREYFGRKT